MSIEGIVQDNLDFSWKHVAAVVLGGLVAAFLARRNFLGILNASDGRVGVDDLSFVKFKTGG